MWKVEYVFQIQCTECRKLLTNGQRPLFSWRKQSRGVSTSNFIIRQITAVSMLMDCIIPWLPTRTVIYPHHWSWLPAPYYTMLSWSGKRTNVFLRKLPSRSWQRTDLIARTTSTTRTTVVRTHPAALQQVASCQPHLALQPRIHSWWIPGIHYRWATNRGCIQTLLLQSSVRSNRGRTQPLPRSSALKQWVLTMLLFLTIWPPRWRLRSLKSEALTQISQ